MSSKLRRTSSPDKPMGYLIVGREILVCWDDGVWYDAVVVCYYEKEDEYKIVYRADDGIEIAPLRNRRWLLAPKKKLRPNRPILDGAIISFIYPKDGCRYQAMVYDYSHRGERIKIAYLEEHSTDNLKGGGWDFITPSPCADDSESVDVAVDIPEAVHVHEPDLPDISPRRIGHSRRPVRSARRQRSGISKRSRRTATEELLASLP